MRQGAFAALLAAVPAISCTAHETWLMPQRFVQPAGATVDLTLTSGMHFPRLDAPIRPERVANAVARTENGEVALTIRPATAHALHLVSPQLPAGDAAFGVRLHPRSIELTDAQVEEYFAEIAASTPVRAAWAKVQGRTRWKEIYIKHARSCTFADHPSATERCSEPMGMPLELVPLRRLSSLTVGDRVRFRLLWQGKALAGIPVGWMDESSSKRHFSVSDSNGDVEFSPGAAGKALLYAVYLRPGADGTPWISDFTTQTIEVRAPR
jgi:hypothetical protein